MNGLKMRGLWYLLFLCVVSITTETVINEDEFDAIIEESVLQDILSDNEESTGFDKLLDRYLKSLMLRYRSKVFQLYREYTCFNGDLCDASQLLQLLPLSSEFDENLFQQKNLLEFQLTSLKQLKICLLPFDPASVSITRLTFQLSLLTASAVDDSTIYIYSIPEDGSCIALGNVKSLTTTPCLLPVSIADQIQLVVAWPCKNNSELIHIYMATSKGLELFQLLDHNKVDQIVDFTYGSRTYLGLINSNRCILYEWTGTHFERTSNTNINGLNYPLQEFVYGPNSFLIGIGKTIVSSLDPTLTVWRLGVKEYNLTMELYQFLTDCKVSDFHLFELSGMQFMAVACVEDFASYLYWWSGSQFLMWQVVAVGERTKQWTSLKLDNGESILIATHFNERGYWLSAYSIRQGHYYLTDVRSELIKDAFQMVNFGLNQFLAIELKNVYSYKLEMKVVENNDIWHDPVDQCVDRLEKMMARQAVINDEYKDDLIIYASIKENQQHNIPDPEHSTECGHFNEELKLIESQLKVLDVDFNSWKQTSGRYIGLKVNELVVNEYLRANHTTVSNGVVNGVNFTELHRSVLTASTNQTFDYPITFENGIDVERLETLSTVNGVHYANIATNVKNLTFTQPQSFTSLDVNNVKVDGKINGVATTDWVLKKQMGRNVIHGRKTFKRLNVHKDLLLHGGTINRVNVNQFVSGVLTQKGGEVQSDVEINGNVLIDGQLLVRLINKVDVDHLLQNAVTIDTEQHFNGFTGKIKDLNVDNLVVNGMINGVRVPDDVLVNAEQLISHPVTIKGRVKVTGDVNVNSGVVNEVKDWSKTVVTRCGDHIITGRKLFIEDIITKAISFEKNRNIVQHFSNVTVDHLTVQSLNNINNVSLLLNSSIVLSRANSLHGSLRCANVRFDGPVSVIGEGSLDQYYITKRTKQDIVMPVMVDSDVIMYGTTWIEREINGIKLQDIPRHCLMKSGDQTIFGHISMTTATLLKNIKLLDYNSLLHQLLYQVGWRLKHLGLWRDVHLEGDLDCQYLNGVDLNSFISRLYYVNDNNLQLKEKSFQHLKVLGDFDIHSLLNGVNTKEFFKNVVRLSTDQIIKGDLRISQTVHCESVDAGMVNEFDLNERLNRLVQVDSSGVIAQHVTFTNGLDVAGDASVQMLNDKNISNILGNVILKSEQEFLTPVTLRGKVTIGELKVLGTINGVKTSNWIRLDDNRTFNGHVAFKSAVKFDTLKVQSTTIRKEFKSYHKFKLIRAKHVQLKGLINGINVTDIVAKRLNPNLPQVVSNRLVVFHGDVTVDRLVTASQPVVNGVHLNTIVDRGLSTDVPQTVLKKVQFTNSSVVNFSDLMEVKGNLTLLKLGYFNLNRTAGFNDGWTHVGNMVFEDDVFIKDQNNQQPFPVEIRGDVETSSIVVNRINAIDLNQLIINRVTLSTDQTILSDIHIKGSISGYKTGMDLHPVIQEDVELNCPVEIHGSIKADKNLTLYV
ncbi:hypothetical protein CHUAL_013774 [Chamberlinius hualienensis]